MPRQSAKRMIVLPNGDVVERTPETLAEAQKQTLELAQAPVLDAPKKATRTRKKAS